MNKKHLGDSYDILKRFWSDSLREIAPLCAYGYFIPEKLRGPYEALTRIPVVDSPPKHYGILLDPDTGILSPRSNQKNRRTHVVLDFILELNKNLHPKYLICFDQSFLRCKQPSPDEQRKEKKEYLWQRGLDSFYYVSHAPFLFIAPEPVLHKIKETLEEMGIPRRGKDIGPQQDKKPTRPLRK